MELAIPRVVRRKADNAGAGRWLEELPALVSQLERDWGIAVAAPFAGGTEAYVAAASMADGSPAVLKLLVPGSAATCEITALRLAAGRGCVRLLRADPGLGALLLERLGPSMFDLRLPLGRRLAELADLAARFWRPVPASQPDGSVLPTGRERAEALAAFIESAWRDLGRPCSRGAIEHALACADRRAGAHRAGRAMLVHGDVHQWNALAVPPSAAPGPGDGGTGDGGTGDGDGRGGDGGFALIDPDGVLAEPEYDLGIMMREDPVELLRDGPYDRARWLADRIGLDATAVWEWGVIERVSTGLLGSSVGLQPVAGQMLAAADLIAAGYRRGP